MVAGEVVVLSSRELQLQIVAWLLWIFIVTILSLPSILFAVAQAPFGRLSGAAVAHGNRTETQVRSSSFAAHVGVS